MSAAVQHGWRRRRRCTPLSYGVMGVVATLCMPSLCNAFRGGAGSGQAQHSAQPASMAGRSKGTLRMAADDFEDLEGTRVESALRVTTRQVNSLRRLVNSFEDLPSPNEPPMFPPANIELPAATRESMDADRSELSRINHRYYELLNSRDVRGMVDLWREDGQIQMYSNEDTVIVGKDEIDKHFDSKFRNKWATNKHHERMDVVVEDERVFLRGINAFVTNKEVWENTKTKEKKVHFSTKILTRSNGIWRFVHVHSGDASQVEVQPQQGQMKLPEGFRAIQVGGGQQAQGQQNILGMLGLGGAAAGGNNAGAGAEDAEGREMRTIITPEGYRIILSGNALGGQAGQQGQGRGAEATKEAILKAIIEDLAKSGRGEIIPLQLGANRDGKQQLFSSASSASGPSSSSNDSSASGKGKKEQEQGESSSSENVTRKTVAALRQLCADGRITVQQKRKLIFSIIRSAKAVEISQVEMAYELLVENALAGEENSMSEFADQCRQIYEQLIAEEEALQDDDFDFEQEEGRRR